MQMKFNYFMAGFIVGGMVGVLAFTLGIKMFGLFFYLM